MILLLALLVGINSITQALTRRRPGLVQWTQTENGLSAYPIQVGIDALQMCFSFGVRQFERTVYAEPGLCLRDRGWEINQTQ